MNRRLWWKRFTCLLRMWRRLSSCVQWTQTLPPGYSGFTVYTVPKVHLDRRERMYPSHNINSATMWSGTVYKWFMDLKVFTIFSPCNSFCRKNVMLIIYSTVFQRGILSGKERSKPKFNIVVQRYLYKMCLTIHNFCIF